jgi:hypothetical protein
VSEPINAVQNPKILSTLKLSFCCAELGLDFESVGRAFPRWDCYRRGGYNPRHKWDVRYNSVCFLPIGTRC